MSKQEYEIFFPSPSLFFADKYDSKISSNGEFEQDFLLEHFNEIFDNNNTSDIDSEDFEDFNKSDFDKNKKDDYEEFEKEEIIDHLESATHIMWSY